MPAAWPIKNNEDRAVIACVEQTLHSGMQHVPSMSSRLATSETL